LNDYPPNRDFHPLGLEYVPSTRTLYAANHNSNGSCIEIFRLDTAARSLSHIRTLADPKLHAPNAIRALSDHELLVSNDHYFLRRSSAVLALAETYLAVPGGSVAYVNLRSGVVAHVARLPFANGLAVVNGTVVAVASTGTPAVYVYDLVGAEGGSGMPRMTLRRKLKTRFAVDNLLAMLKGGCWWRGIRIRIV